MKFIYLYPTRHCYFSVPCDRTLPLDDTYIPLSIERIPSPEIPPDSRFRAALRAAFSEPVDGVRSGQSRPSPPPLQQRHGKNKNES
ncbi:hypothetical protein BJX96DRAFT_149767, partial [Aspergillus floccosus]